MAEPKKGMSPQELLQRLRDRRSRIPVMRPQIVAEPDAVNETLRASGHLQRMETTQRAIEQLQRMQEAQQRGREFRRTQYRRRKKAQQEQDRQTGQGNVLTLFPVEWMSDAAVDAAIAQEMREAQFRANQPQIGPANPVWSYPAETRRALGYYTQEERELAARMNDMRSSTFFGNVMPNFGRQAAYNNPGAEMDAYRQTALYMPNAVVAGASFGLPSATTTAASGLRTGWQTAKAAGANLGQRATAAVTTAAKEAAPIVTNPRWAATTATVATPMVAAASDGSELSGGFWNWVGDHPMESLLIGTLAYKGGKGLWNKGAGKLRIPAEPTEGRPSTFTEAPPERGTSSWNWNPAEYPPVMRREPVIDDYIITIEPPSQPRPLPFPEIEPPKPTGLRPKKKGRSQWDALNQAHSEWEARRNQYDLDNAELNRQWDEYEQSAYGPARYDDARFQADYDDWQRNAQAQYQEDLQRHQADIDSYNAEQVRLNDEYDNAVAGYNQRRTANEQAWLAYHESDPYKLWLERKNRVLNFRNNAWNRVRNNWYWAVPAGYIGYKWMTGGYSDQNLQPNPTNNPNGDNTQDPVQTVEPDSIRVRQFISVTPDGRVVVPNVSGTGNDTIVPKTYETPQFDD